MQRDLRAGNGVFTSIFGGKSITSNDIKSIQAMNNAMKGGATYAQAWQTHMKGATVAAKQQAAQCIKNKGSLTELTRGMKSATVASKAAAVGMNLLATAGNMIAFMAISKGIELLVNTIDEYIHAAEIAREKSSELTDSWVEENSSIDDSISKYKELRAKLQDTSLTASEVKGVKEELLVVQQDLIDKYGQEALGIDLVNGKYDEQIAKLKELSKQKAQDYVAENYSNIQEDKKYVSEKVNLNASLGFKGTLARPDDYSDSGFDLGKYLGRYNKLDAKVVETDGQYGLSGTVNLVTSGTREEVYEQLSQLFNDLSNDFGESNEDVNKFKETLSAIIQDSFDTEQMEKSKDNIKKYAEAQILSQNGTRKLYEEAALAVDKYNEALVSGKGVDKAKANLDSVKESVASATSDISGASYVFDDIYSGINSTAEKAYEITKAFENNTSVKEYAEQLKGLSSEDLLKIDFEDNVKQAGEEAFSSLMDVIGLSEGEVQALIDKLVELGYVQGSTLNNETDISYNFDDFWNSIGNTEKATDLKEELFKLASTGELTGSKLKSLAESNEILKSAMDSSGLSANKLAEKIRELNIDNIESDIKSFADALDKVKNKQSLTTEETAKLIAKDTSLAGAVKKTKDGYLLEKDALEKVVNSHKEKYNVAVSYEINETKKVIDKIKDRIDAYKEEIKALQLVSEARNDEYSKAVESGYDAQDASRAIFGNSQAMSDAAKNADISKELEKDQKKYKKYKKKLKELMDSLNNTDTSTSKDKNSKSKSSKVFDYIQIKIARLERLHSKYLDKASDGTKTLTERTKNYNKVLSITERQINAQDKAIARYNKQLKKIGLDESIAKKIRDGAFDIDTLKGKKKDKAEKYQDIYEKKLDAQDKKYDLKTGKSETERNKYQVELDALENKRKAEESISDELKNQIELKERIGDKDTSSDYSAVNESILKQINNYKKQIPVLEKQLGTVKKGSDKWYEYKEAIDSVKDSISSLTQEMMDNATKGIEAIQNASDEYLKSLDDEDALNNAKKENALTTDEKNGYIQNTINNIAKRKTKYAQDSLSYLNEKNNSVNLINATSKKVQKSEGSVFATISSLVNSGQKIPEDILKQVKDANLLINCYAYNSAITAYETNEATRKLYDETSKTDIRNAVIDKVDAINNEYDTKNTTLDREEANIQQDIAENEAKGIGQSVKDYRKLIEIDEQRKKNAIDQKKALEERLKTEIALGNIATDQNGLVDENDQAYQEFMSSIASCDEEISNCIVSQTNYNKAIKEMNVENYKTAISLLDSMIDKYKRLQSLADVHNSKLSDKDILAQIGLNDEKIAENNKYLSTIKDNIRTYLTDELHMSAENVEEFINLMENSPHKLRGFMNDLGFKDFNEKTFPDLFNNFNEFNSTMNDSNSLMVEQENLLDSLAQKRIDILSEYLEALKKQKDYKDRIFAIEKAQYDLEKAKNNLTKKVWDGQQWVYTADTEAVQSAQESLDNAKFEEFNNSIQDLIEVLEKFIKDFNIYDDNGNMINNPDVILKKGVLGEYTIADIDKIFTDKVLDTSKLSGLMSNIQYAIPNVSIPNINLPEIQSRAMNQTVNYDKIELVLPNITDASTGADLAKSFVNELKNLPSYAKQYDWNR